MNENIDSELLKVRDRADKVSRRPKGTSLITSYILQGEKVGNKFEVF